jgi:hypothetical protein
MPVSAKKARSKGKGQKLHWDGKVGLLQCWQIHYTWVPGYSKYPSARCTYY